MGGPIGRWLIRNHNFFADTIVRTLFGDKSRLTAKIHAHYLMPLAKPDERKGSWVFPAEIIGSSDWLQALWEKRDLLRGKKILIAWGMKDIGFGEKELKTWMHAFPDAKVVRFENAGHFIPEEKPDELIGEIKKTCSGVSIMSPPAFNPQHKEVLDYRRFGCMSWYLNPVRLPLPSTKKLLYTLFA